MLSTFSKSQQVFQWHEDGIELPAGAVHLARSAASDVQAFRFGEHAYGFQFHLEANEPLIDRWLTVSDNRKTLAEEAGRIDPDEIRATTHIEIETLQALSQETFSRWIDRFEISPRRRNLPSR